MPVDNCNGCAFWDFCHGCSCAGCSCAAVHLRAVLAVLRGLYPPASTLPPPSGCRFQPARDKKVPCQDQSVAQQMKTTAAATNAALQWRLLSSYPVYSVEAKKGYTPGLTLL